MNFGIHLLSCSCFEIEQTTRLTLPFLFWQYPETLLSVDSKGRLKIGFCPFKRLFVFSSSTMDIYFPCFFFSRAKETRGVPIFLGGKIRFWRVGVQEMWGALG